MKTILSVVKEDNTFKFYMEVFGKAYDPKVLMCESDDVNFVVDSAKMMFDMIEHIDNAYLDLSGIESE